MKKIIHSLLLCMSVLMLSACTSSEQTIQTVQIEIHCKQEGYYNTLSGSQVYHYVYNTGDNTWSVEIPELCVQLSVEDRKYGGGANDAVRDMYRQSGILREGNVVQQNPLSQEMRNKLIEKFPNEDLYLEDMMPTQVQFSSILSGDMVTGSIQKRWKTYLPSEECTPMISSSVRDIFVDTSNLTQYKGNIANPTQNSPIEGCPSVFVYSGENRIIMPLDYPQGTYEFFAPKIEFTDR